MHHILRSFQPVILNEYTQFYNQYISTFGFKFDQDQFDAIPIIKDSGKYAIVVPKTIADGFNNRKWNFDMPNERIFGNIICVPIVINIFNSGKIQYNISQLPFPYTFVEGKLCAFFPAKLRWILWHNYIKYISANMKYAENKTGNITEFNKYLSEISIYLANCIEKFNDITADGNFKDNSDIVMIEGVNESYIEHNINRIRKT